MITSRERVRRQAEALVRLDEHPRVASSPVRLGEVRRGRAVAALAVEFVVDDRHGQVRLVADRFLARRDRIEARRERTQRLHEVLRRPLARAMTLQHVDDLQVLRAVLRRRVLVPGRSASASPASPRAPRVLGEERPRQARDLAPGREPLAQRAPTCRRVRRSRRRRGRSAASTASTTSRRIFVPDAERVARLYVQARALERDLDVPHVLGRAAAGDALVGERPRRRTAARGCTAARPATGRSRVTVADGCGCPMLSRAAGDELLEPRRRPGRS